MGLALTGLILIGSCHLHAFHLLHLLKRQRLQKPIVVYNIYICSSFESFKALQQIIFMI